jgi:hypothetical protein
MVTVIDLSAKDLRTNSVVALIRQHAANPGPRQILFKVSSGVLSRFRAGQPAGINVSAEEAREINKVVGISANRKEYRFTKKHMCKHCGRRLTFFDVFQSGRKRHGDKYIRDVIAGDGYHIQVHRRNSKLDVTCTQCGAQNALDDGCYRCINYTYA